MRNSQITDMNCRVTVAKLEIENGVEVRRFRPLTLELKNIIFFPMTWTINHPINEESPLWGMSHKDLEDADVEFLIMLSGFDDTFSQTVNVRHSFTYAELIFGAKFISVFGTNKEGQTTQDIRKISDYEVVKL